MAAMLNIKAIISAGNALFFLFKIASLLTLVLLLGDFQLPANGSHCLALTKQYLSLSQFPDLLQGKPLPLHCCLPFFVQGQIHHMDRFFGGSPGLHLCPYHAPFGKKVSLNGFNGIVLNEAPAPKPPPRFVRFLHLSPKRQGRLAALNAGKAP